jgi:hypothetical protein
VRARAAYDEALRELRLDDPAAVESYRRSLEQELDRVLADLPDGPQVGGEAIVRIIEGLSRVSDDPSDLERLLHDQGAQYFPTMSEVDVWALKESGAGDKQNVYWEHIFTHSADREAELRIRGKKRLHIAQDGTATNLYGPFKLLEEQGAIFWSTSQEALSRQDPRGWTFGPDEVLYDASKYALLTNTDPAFTRKHIDTIRDAIPRFRDLPFDQLQHQRTFDKRRAPHFADWMAVAEVGLWSGGRVVGKLRTRYRMRHLAMDAMAEVFERGPRATSALRRLVVHDDQRGSADTDLDDWLVSSFVKQRKAAFEHLRLATRDDGELRHGVPLYSALERNPDKWHTLHCLNTSKRFAASQRLREWLLGEDAHTEGEGDGQELQLRGKEDEELDQLFGPELRRRIRESIGRRYFAAVRDNPDVSTESLFLHPQLRAVLHPVRADLMTVAGRLVMPVMREEFPEALEQAESVCGLQRDVTEGDMAAVAERLKVTEPDPVAKIAILEAVNAVAPFLVRAITQGTGQTISGRSGTGDEVRRTPSLIGQTRAAHRIEARLGEGAMGIVYLATQLNLDRPVALKVLSGKAVGDESLLRRFHGEARIGAKLNHPNIVQVYDARAEWPLHFISMEYMDGGCLQDQINETGGLPWQEVHRALVGTARALEHIERKRIIHRDIKPQNLMLASDGEVKLADFGLACEVGEDEETVGQSGTLHFTSPERMRGLAFDSRSDLYSLGATAYNALAGRPPFKAESLGDLVTQVLNEEPEPLSDVRPDLPTEFVPVVSRLMAKDPDERYGSAVELVADLRRIAVDGIS